MGTLAHAIAFDRAIRLRAAERVTAIPGGVVLRHDRLASKWVLNALMLDAPLPAGLDADALRALADVYLGDLPHRYVVVDDAAAGARLALPLRARGWSVQRLLYMELRRTPDRPPRAGVAGQISEPELRQIQLAMALEERRPSPPRGGMAALVAGEAALRAGTRSVGFGAGEAGVLAASCTLFLEDRAGVCGAALIDEVGTLAAARGRGLARAVIGAAVDAARASWAAPIVIPADAEDWPRHLYARLGFDPIGEQYAFALPEASRRSR